MLIFDDQSDNDWNRQKVLERLSQVTLPAGLQPQIGPDYSPVGQIYWYTLRSTNPKYDLMELKSLEDWVLEKQFKSVPNVVDVVSFGGITREYQVRVDPDKLVSYGLSIGQVEQQLANNNVNAGGSFVEAGLQQINVRAVGLVKNIHDIEATVLKTQNGTPFASGISRRLRRARNPAGPDRQGDSSRGRQGGGQPGRGRRHRAAAQRRQRRRDPGRHPREGRGTERAHSAAGREDRSVSRPQRPGAPTTHTVLHNLTEGIVLVVVILFIFLGNARGALIVAMTIPFSLLFASICLDLNQIPANLLSLGALDFGMVVEGAVVMVENIVRHLGRERDEARSSMDQIREAAHEVQRPVFYSIGIIITAYLPIFTLQRVEGRLFKPMAWTVTFALLGALIFSMLIAPVLSSFRLPQATSSEWRNPV